MPLDLKNDSIILENLPTLPDVAYETQPEEIKENVKDRKFGWLQAMKVNQMNEKSITSGLRKKFFTLSVKLC